jgi:hypothetical protein
VPDPAAYLAEVTINRPFVVTLLLVAALAASGCGTAEPTDSAPAGRLQLRAISDHPVRSGPLDTSQETVSRLDPHLLDALQAAARDAQHDGVAMVVTSGWRSRAHQGRLLADAVREYGSEEDARRYVATPDTSAHVTGDAVDIGPTDADDWLIRHGSDYGLCQVFANEIWHFELATDPGGRCPELLPDGSSRS